MKSILLSATVLAGLAAPAWAGINDLEINADTASSGSIKTLSIIQENSVLGNKVTATSGGGSSLPVSGPWHSISINQQGGNSKLYGAFTADATSGTASLTATYSGGHNTHALTIGATTPPVNPVVAITVAGASNTITDTLDGSSLNYTLGITGASNTLTNSIAATGAVSLSQTITGSSNTVSNNVSGSTDYTHSLTVTGSSNIIANTVSGGGSASISQSILSGSNMVTTTLDGGTGQSSTLNVDASSLVTYTQHSSGVGTTSVVNLTGVNGAASGPALVNLTQTAAATGASATLSVNGGSYTMGTGVGTGGAFGVNVSQASAGAILNASVVANANGYTANFTQ